jgi:hypothetical protein
VSHRSKKVCSIHLTLAVGEGRGLRSFHRGKSSTPFSPRTLLCDYSRTAKMQNRDMASTSSIRNCPWQPLIIHTAIDIIPKDSSESTRLRPRVHQRSSNTALGGLRHRRNGDVGDKTLGPRECSCRKDRYSRVLSSSNLSTFLHIDLNSACTMHEMAGTSTPTELQSGTYKCPDVLQPIVNIYLYIW